MATHEIGEWHNEIAEETAKSLKDIAELSDTPARAEATQFILRLLTDLTDWDKQEMKAIIEVVAMQIDKMDGEIIWDEREKSEIFR